ncbi:hypothetical protein H8B06_19290 [Sphingobacterium sp. DN00404]|uniref:DUF5000 domain-containing protein n=1 Tax=Sphingobacterium micropteri TaxID=2763501 RepID=A0ABR7YUE2_9SPHI|nr:hypothetical protein [Sphingobacterium micropteri]MBD1434973.1 hypothetical protein [Sphingobacterium micropteri]
MVLKKILPLFVVFLVSCHNDQNSFIAPTYRGKSPLGEIKNLPIISDESRPFSLDTASWIQIYGTGETDIGLASIDPTYWYKADEVEIYLQDISGENIKLSFPLHDENGKSVEIKHEKEDVLFVAGYDSQKRLYRAQISIPLRKFANSVHKEQKLKLNVTVADNDDKIKQKAKLVWVGERDPGYDSLISYGEIVLKEKIENPLENSDNSPLQSLYQPMKTNLMDRDTNFVDIANLIFGLVNKAEDFSARMYSTWDTTSLHLHLIILDNREGAIMQGNIEKSVYLHDRGWIENEAGNTIWQMTNYHTQHAGGAEKNRKVDTAIYLPKGKYALRYVTDESHSWDNWDDKPPETPFYGIVIFRKEAY